VTGRYFVDLVDCMCGRVTGLKVHQQEDGDEL
jgi:hypothetical protein